MNLIYPREGWKGKEKQNKKNKIKESTVIGGKVK